MQKRKKQLLGLSGLAVVGVMTAIALSLPAAAYENVMDAKPLDATGGQSTTVTVNVTENGLGIRIASPKNNENVVPDENGEVPFTLITSNAQSIQPILSYVDAQGRKVEKKLPVIYPNGQVTVNGKLVLLIAETEYTFRVIATGADGTTIEDSIKFTYRAVRVESKGETAENNDPIIHIYANSAVNKMQVQVYYPGDSKPLFVNSEGKEEPIILDREDLDENGYAMLTLPFAKYKAPAGTYDVVVVAYGEDGKVVSMNRVEVKYSPKAPEVPGTGSMLLDNLNISHMDYLLTGLIAFGAVAGFAVYLVFRKNRR